MQTVNEPSALLLLQVFGDTHLCVYVSDVMGQDLVADVPLAVGAPDPAIDHNCPEFPNQWSAQDFLEQFGNGSDLDRDLDGVACEDNRNPSRAPSPHPWPVELLPPPSTTTPQPSVPVSPEPAPVARIPTLAMSAAVDAAWDALHSSPMLRFQARLKTVVRCERRSRLQAACTASWNAGHLLIGRGTHRRSISRYAFRANVAVERTGSPASWRTTWRYRVRRTKLQCVREHRRACAQLLTGASSG